LPNSSVLRIRGKHNVRGPPRRRFLYHYNAALGQKKCRKQRSELRPEMDHAPTLEQEKDGVKETAKQLVL